MTTILSMPAPKPTARTNDGKRGRRIEWVGEKSVMDEPFVWTGIATGRFTREQEALLRRTALNRCARTDTAERVIGNFILLLDDRGRPVPGPDGRPVEVRSPEGMSGEYRFHPANRWTCVVAFADADVLLSCPSGHEFRDLDAAEADEPATVAYPPVDIRLVERTVLSETGQERTEKVG